MDTVTTLKLTREGAMKVLEGALLGAKRAGRPVSGAVAVSGAGNKDEEIAKSAAVLIGM